MKKAIRSTNALKLDSENVRIDAVNPTQLQILSDLWENDDVKDLIESIVERGYLPLEAIFIVKEDGKFVVIEGNRRLAACKLILDPAKLGRTIEKTIRRILTSTPTFSPASVEKLDCLHATDRDALIQVMLTKHIGRAFKPWNDWLRSRYIYGQLEKHEFDQKAVVNLLKIPSATITKAVKMYEMHSLSVTLGDDPIKKHLSDRKAFNPTTFARIYESSEIRDRLKFSFTREGRLKIQSDKEEFARAWSKLIHAFVDGKIDSRNFNDKEAQAKWLDKNFPKDLTPEFSQEKPLKLADFEIKDPAKDEATKGYKDDNEPKQKAQPAPKPIKKNINKLIGPSFPNGDSLSIRVAGLIRELKAINFRNTPNLAAVGVRTLWDLTLVSYFQLDRGVRMNKLSKSIILERRKKNPGFTPPKQFSPDSLEMVGKLIKQPTEYSFDGVHSKALETLKAQGTFATLNQWVHNPALTADPGEVETIWNKIAPLVEHFIKQAD